MSEGWRGQQGALILVPPLGGGGTPPQPHRPCSVHLHTPASSPTAPGTSLLGSPGQGRPSQTGPARGQLISHRPFPSASEPSSPSPHPAPWGALSKSPGEPSNHPFLSQCVGTIPGSPSCADVSGVQPGPPCPEPEVTCSCASGPPASGLLVGSVQRGAPRRSGRRPPCTGLTPRSQLLLGRFSGPLSSKGGPHFSLVVSLPPAHTLIPLFSSPQISQFQDDVCLLLDPT